MERKILAEVPEYPESKSFDSLKENINKLMQAVSADKNLSSNNKEAYTRILKEIDWGMSKVIPKWPTEVQRMMENFRKAMQDFELSLVQSGSVGICGGGRAVKSVEISFRNVISYQQMFALIGHYQDKNLREEFVSNVVNAYEKITPRQVIQQLPPVIVHEKIRQIPKPAGYETSQKCKYCELYLSLSLMPNGSLARQLLTTLPDVQWVNGMLYEQGKIFQQDIPRAIAFYEKAVKKNNAEALYKLGSLNEQGLHGRPNEYISMWKRAAQMGSLEAITDMGYLYEKGVENEQTGQMILSPDSERAHQYYLQAANRNFPRGLNNLGSFYQLDPTFKNPEKSLLYFNKAIEAGYVKAMFNLGLCYSKGFLKTTDRDKARKLFKRAAELGDHYSKLFYVDMLLNGDTSNCTEDELYEANKFCRDMIAEQQQRAEAYYFLGIMYEAGLGAPQQPKTSLLYFLKAAKLNYVHAVIKLADCYRTGFGVEIDFKEALRYYEQVLDKRPEVLVSIGQMYEQGSDDLRRDNEKAFQYYFEACNKGVQEGFNKVGGMYKQGKYVKRDEAKANEYFRKAQQMAQDNLTNSRTSLMQSESDMIHSNYQKKAHRK